MAYSELENWDGSQSARHAQRSMEPLNHPHQVSADTGHTGMPRISAPDLDASHIQILPSTSDPWNIVTPINNVFTNTDQTPLNSGCVITMDGDIHHVALPDSQPMPSMAVSNTSSSSFDDNIPRQKESIISTSRCNSSYNADEGAIKIPSSISSSIHEQTNFQTSFPESCNESKGEQSVMPAKITSADLEDENAVEQSLYRMSNLAEDNFDASSDITSTQTLASPAETITQRLSPEELSPASSTSSGLNISSTSKVIKCSYAGQQSSANERKSAKCSSMTQNNVFDCVLLHPLQISRTLFKPFEEIYPTKDEVTQKTTQKMANQSLQRKKRSSILPPPPKREGLRFSVHATSLNDLDDGEQEGNGQFSLPSTVSSGHFDALGNGLERRNSCEVVPEISELVVKEDHKLYPASPLSSPTAILNSSESLPRATPAAGMTERIGDSLDKGNHDSRNSEQNGDRDKQLQESGEELKILKRKRDSWLEEIINSEGCCHQCRRRNFFAKMKCTTVIDGWVCPLEYCHRCILLRYPSINFDIYNYKFICPKCTNACNCLSCCKRRGDVYVPSKRGWRFFNTPLFYSEIATECIKRTGKLPDIQSDAEDQELTDSEIAMQVNIGKEAESWIRTCREQIVRAGRRPGRVFVGSLPGTLQEAGTIHVMDFVAAKMLDFDGSARRFIGDPTSLQRPFVSMDKVKVSEHSERNRKTHRALPMVNNPCKRPRKRRKTMRQHTDLSTPTYTDQVDHGLGSSIPMPEIISAFSHNLNMPFTSHHVVPTFRGPTRSPIQFNVDGPVRDRYLQRPVLGNPAWSSPYSGHMHAPFMHAYPSQLHPSHTTDFIVENRTSTNIGPLLSTLSAHETDRISSPSDALSLDNVGYGSIHHNGADTGHFPSSSNSVNSTFLLNTANGNTSVEQPVYRQSTTRLSIEDLENATRAALNALYHW